MPVLPAHSQVDPDTEVTVTLHADNYITVNWLQRLIAHFRDGVALVCAGGQPAGSPQGTTGRIAMTQSIFA
eukprot:5861594-Amphidinium_carterae.1